MTDTQQIETKPHGVAIDSKQRLRTVASLADGYDHQQSKDVIRSLALAAGCTTRGGRVYAPLSRWRDTPLSWRGWAQFRRFLCVGSVPESLTEDMLTLALRQGAHVELSPALVARILSKKKASARW
jgi:hypothetical protein